MNQYNLDWDDLAFGSKKPLTSLKATFVLAPRELSAARFTQLVKQYLPAGNMVVGISKQPYVQGFEKQPQFTMLQNKTIQSVVDKVNNSASPNKIYLLSYNQQEAKYFIDRSNFKQVVLVNGSWKYTFHSEKLYYLLAHARLPITFVSPFCDESEAKDYATKQASVISATFPLPATGAKFAETEMLEIATTASYYSYDYSFQTGVSLGIKSGKAYKLLLTAHNEVVPYETYALHHGNARETNLSPAHDLNHYDTVHAETSLVLKAQKQGVSLKGTSLFINLLPCPTCSRLLAASDINEVVYTLDHSNGYAVAMLEAAGKVVRRSVPELVY